jgi:hypothetical protein
MKQYKSKFKEIGYILPEVENFELFFLQNAVEHRDYTLSSVGYVCEAFGKQMININLWTDECWLKLKGSYFSLENKKIGALINIFHKSLKVYDMDEDIEVLIIKCELPADKNNGQYIFVFKKK